jgi:hypothetical protein
MQRGQLFEENISDFTQMISGDYGHIEFTNEGKSMWIMYPWGSLSFYSNPTFQNSPVAGYTMANDNPGAWIPPIVVNPHSNKDEVYVLGGNENGSGSRIIHVEYMNEALIATELPHNFGTGGIASMAISPFDENIWYVAMSNGRFLKSTDRGQTFKLKQTMLSNGQYLYGSCILPSSKDTNLVLLSGNGYGPAPVYISRNGGESFTEFSAGLPQTTAFNIVFNEDESLIYAATEAGPYVYIKSKDFWYPLSGRNTPNQTYWSVEYVKSTKIARFSTYGRGVWDFKESKVPTSSNSIHEVNITVSPNPTSDYIQINHTEEINTVEILSHSGQVMIRSQTDRIDVSQLRTGIYIAKILDRNGVSIAKKFVKI